MKRIMLVVVCLTAAWGLLAAGPLDAARQRRLQLTDSVSQALDSAATAADSLRLLYDLYDLARTADRAPAAERIYRQAVEMGDTAARFDALRMLANAYSSNDSMQREQLRRAELMPPSDMQKETVTFIRIQLAAAAARNLQGQERLDALHHMLMEFERDTKVDLYRRVEMLATICMFLKERSNDKLIRDYIAELDRLVDRLPQSALSLRSTLITYMAIATTRSQNYEEAVKAEEAMVALLNELERIHRAERRVFSNYDTHYYLTYMRMLMNYRALTPEQVEDMHRRILEIADRNEDVAADRRSRLVDEAFYSMARGDYASAARLLDTAAERPANRSNRFVILHNLIEAAEKTGNDPLLLSAYRRYTPMLQQRQSSIDSDRVLEYQILHDLNSLATANADLSVQRQMAVVASRKTMNTIVGVALGVVLTLLVVCFVAWRRGRWSRHKAEHALSQLTVERDLLREAQSQLIQARDKARGAERQKTDFINTISHEISEPLGAILGYTQLIVDSVDGAKRRVMEKFVRIIEINAQLLKSLVNDVLDASELESSQVSLKYKSVDVRELAQFAVDSQSLALQPGVTIDLHAEPGTDTDTYISTDPVRTQQVLVNLISNAVKFTEQGTVTVTYGVDAAANRVRFTVTDTGPGIPEGKEEAIFRRFEKLGSYKPGIGLGLHISRTVARMLGGDVTVDTAYTGGARFIFTLPATM